MCAHYYYSIIIVIIVYEPFFLILYSLRRRHADFDRMNADEQGHFSNMFGSCQKTDR